MNLSSVPKRLPQRTYSPSPYARQVVPWLTGWSNNSHGGAALTLLANTPADFEVDGAVEIITQKPSDVPDFWVGNKITGRDGDAIIVKVQFTCTPTSAAASNLNLKVDIGGAVGVVEERDFPLTRGAMVAHPINFTFVAYTAGTWQANGGRIILTVDGPCSIPASNRRILVARAHKAR